MVKLLVHTKFNEKIREEVNVCIYPNIVAAARPRGEEKYVYLQCSKDGLAMKVEIVEMLYFSFEHVTISGASGNGHNLSNLI